MTLIEQKNNEQSKQPSSKNGMMYGCAVGASCREAHGMLSPAVDAKASEPCVMVSKDKSDGKEQALAVGCDADNGNAAARSSNCNNAASNGSSNFAWVFAVKNIETSRK